MNNGSTQAVVRQIKVPFHGADLFVVEHDGQPFVPMHPLVEGIGVSWQGQHEKFSANRQRWTIKNILMIAKDGKQREQTCMPLRKLPGWLMTLEPKKIRDESIRARVVQYQNECDDALWQYWNEGIAINPRASFSVNPEDVLNGDQQETLRLMVKTLVERLPKAKQGGAAIKVWSKLKAHFKVPYRQIPQAEFTEAVSIVTRTAAEWEIVNEPVAPTGIHFVVPEHGRYLVISSAAGADVYNVNGFQLVARDTAARMKLEMLALGEELARLRTRLRIYGGEDDPTVLKPVAFGMHVI